MAHIASSPEEPFIEFDRGIDREDSRSDIRKGGYDDAQNIVLRCPPQGGTHACAVLRDIDLDALITWQPGNAIYVVPYTFSTFVSNVLSFSTHLLRVTDLGNVWRYDSGSPGTETLVRRGFTASQKYWTHAVFDTFLLTFNGRDAPMKYGQHFLFANEARPFLFPIGSKPISPLGAAITDENWTHGATSGFVADASVPDGGSRVHTQSLNVKATENSFNSWTVAHDLLAGPYPYGGTDFSATDSMVFQISKAAGTGNVRIRFGNDAGTAHFEFTQSVTGAAGWQTFSLLRSTAVTTGAPVWSNIKRVTYFNDDATNQVYFDDNYMLYADAPPALQVATFHKGRIVGGGAPTAGGTNSTLANLYWSRALFPDEFPVANATTVSGGTQGLTRANQVNAVREFGPSVVVGTPHSINSFTFDSAGNAQLLSITNEIGIDSHRAMVETPNAALMFFWQRGIYVMRSTWRAYGSGKVNNYLNNLWLDEPWWTSGCFDEKTQTIRWWFREKTPGGSDPTKTTKGIIFDYIRAQELGEGVWPATTTQLADQAIPAIVNSQREVLYTNLDKQGVTRMGVTSGGALTCSISLPWMARAGKDKLTKWQGLIVPYATANGGTVKVFARYASHPQQFDSAVFTLIQTLPTGPGMAEQARVLFGSTSRWIQVKLQTEVADGMEIFVPIEMIALPTARVP